MDIIVTIPKGEISNIEKEDNYASNLITRDMVPIQYWKVGRVPKNLNKGDRVYFVLNGAIKYYHEFLGLVENPKCDVTGRVWEGVNLILKYPEVKCDEIKMKGFQGFRYVK
jgi:hypothetical protein